LQLRGDEPQPERRVEVIRTPMQSVRQKIAQRLESGAAFLRFDAAAEVATGVIRFVRVVRSHLGVTLAPDYSKYFASILRMADWSFLTNHGRVLLCIAHDPGVRLRDIAASLDITERSAYGIVSDLSEAGYVLKEKDGRRNRYIVQQHLPLPETTIRARTVGEVLDLLVGTDDHHGTTAAKKPAKKAVKKTARKTAKKTRAGRSAQKRR
jgi:IclR helix-turn-helix domain